MKKKTLTPEAFAKGKEFVEQLLQDGTPMDVAKAALGQLMVVQGLAVNGKQKKATAKKLGISREWVSRVLGQTERKRARLIPVDLRRPGN